MMSAGNDIVSAGDDMMSVTERIDRIKGLMADGNIDAAVISDPYNIRYLSGFTGGEGYLYISDKRQCMLVDSRYTLWAEDECKDTDVITIKDNYYDTINDFIKADAVRTAALEGNHLTYNEFRKFREKLPSCDMVSAGDEFTNLRSVKDEYEIAMIAHAEAIGDMAFEHILGVLRPGMTEKEVAMELEMYMRSHGAEALSFPVIAASGTNSASPHATPSDKKLEYGDFLTMDFGCVYNGYCSDMTRTVIIGRADEKQKEIYDIVLRAQNAALCGLKAGMTGAEADMLARKVICDAGYGEQFGHGLGHSVGLYIHESPRLSKTEKQVLKEGMTVTVEPGIYLGGKYGVRIEDTVVIKDDGIVNLAHSEKKLIEL